MRIVSDNFQVISPATYEALAKKEASFITSFINRLIASGSDAIDLNLGPLGKESATVIPYLLDVVRSVTHLLSSSIRPTPRRHALPLPQVTAAFTSTVFPLNRSAFTPFFP